MERKQAFRIGELSRLYNISLDSIRYYEEAGLLKPIRDPNNNYRLYTLEDIRTVTTIRELLALGFSIAEIKHFEENKTVSNTMTMLEKELNIINESLVKLYQTKESIQTRLDSIKESLQNPSLGKIQVLNLPDRPCIMISYCNIPDDYVTLSAMTYSKTHDQSIDTIGACTCFTLDLENSNPESDYYRTYNVFFYSRHPNYKSNYTLPAGKYLSLTYQGHPKLTKQYMPSLFSYAKEHNYKITGMPIEFGHIDTYESRLQDEFVQEIQIPVEKA